MTKYENDCAIIIHAEMEDGIKNHGLFATTHDGLAVIEEELTECSDELKRAKKVFKLMKKAVFTDSEQEALDNARLVAQFARYCMIEAMQTAAMAQKFLKTFGGEEVKK